MITDTDRLNALEKMGNIAVWRGFWALHMGEKAGKPICTISDTDEDGNEIGERITQAETLREAIDKYLANA
jgi:hypothetical protein